MMNKGVRQIDIAREYGVSRQYINKLAKIGGRESPVTMVTRNFPWEVHSDFYPNTAYQALRLLGHLAVDPDGISGSSLTKIKSFVRKLRNFNQVIDYDPEHPAIPGLLGTPGFAYLNREFQDEDLVIRVKPGIHLTPVGRQIWRLSDSIF